MSDSLNTILSSGDVRKDSKDYRPIDMKHLEEFTGGRIEIEKKLFTMFLEQTDKCLEDMQKSSVSGDQSQWKKAAHLLKGSALNLGANDLAEVSKKAEESFAADAETKSKLFNDINKKFLELKIFLEQRGII